MQLSFSSAWTNRQRNSEDADGAPVVREACGVYRVATPQELMRAAAQQLERAFNCRLPVSEPSVAIDYVVTRLALSEVEVFGVMFLDAQLRIIAFEEMFKGTLSEASVYPREVVKAAIRHNAHAILVAHNHPSGSSQPSQADIAVTRRLKEAIGLVNVSLVDHVIVAAGRGHSMAKMGLL
ncbi:JAB domain-containing protein [Achromobacter xylosoxidans]|uniref:JAB domain-containing protein n=1 Tax=Alcaligenes xylosoxydans xylosoxydans TaxID=85698 RepID=UPI0006C89B42|nr:JAB domain-containing protein [Achromobacter xylosoxidans]